jgi:prophage antirepressor-like protein
MDSNTSIKIFETKRVRTAWNEDEEEWYFSVVDVVGILTDQPTQDGARNYWKVLKKRLIEEGNELVTNCNRLKLPAQDGKMRMTDVASTEQIFRIIQSIPSPKAEPFKQWLAQTGKERLDQMQDPELSIEQAMADYKRLGYSDNWINQRLKSIEIRKDLTDEWKSRGLQEGIQFASLTDIIYKTWAGKTAKEYKKFKGLKKENLRDNMTNKELVINMLAELSTKEISETSNPETMTGHEDVARRGGNIAREARLKLEAETGKKVVSPLNAKNVLGIKGGNENESGIKA